MLKRFVCLALFVFVSPAWADASALASLVKTLESMHSFHAQFSQTLADAQGKTLQQLQGDLYVQKPGKLHWQSYQPLPQQVITDGKTLWVYDEDLEQVTVKPFSGELSQTPALLFSGSTAEIDKSYVVEVVVEDVVDAVADRSASAFDKRYKLTPRNKKSMFTALMVGLKGEKVVSLVMFDSLGQKTQIDFSQVDMNASIAADLFTFVPPAGVDVLVDE